MDKLQEYTRKRHFDKTSEPRGNESPEKAAGLRFVVQHHIASRDHYDFRLEWDGVLKSWAVPKGPSYDTHDKRLAIQVEDHPLDYGGFEGTIPKGEYGGGTVMLWDQGEWDPLVDVAKGLESGSLKFALEGSRLKGKWALVRMKPRDGEKSPQWLLIKERDDYVDAYDIREFDTSVTTGRSMEEIAEGKPVKKASGAGRKKKAASVATPTKGVERPVSEVLITSPEKVLFPVAGITKQDVAEYYKKVAKRMLPYVENRILSVVRCPGGIESSCFYKKHPANDRQGVVAVQVPKIKKPGSEEYFYVPDAYGLLFEVQMNTLEFHVWGSRVETLEKPDVMVFDLDPDEGMDADRIREGVRHMKSLLDDLSLVSFLKTSGGKGYHVVVPFRPSCGWEAFSDFARNLAKTMEATWPDRYTSNVRKNRRNNRIFIDWIRNGRGATSIAPYSVRAREGGPVSMPITWKELDTVEPDGVSMQDAVKRLRRKDPWQGFFEVDQRLK